MDSPLSGRAVLAALQQHLAQQTVTLAATVQDLVYDQEPCACRSPARLRDDRLVVQLYLPHADDGYLTLTLLAQE